MVRAATIVSMLSVPNKNAINPRIMMLDDERFGARRNIHKSFYGMLVHRPRQ
jgi:hypothetical protein